MVDCGGYTGSTGIANGEGGALSAPDSRSAPAVRLAATRPIYARVVALQDATPDIRIIRLTLVTGGPFRFAAGQYARVTFNEHRPRLYSIASSPEDDFVEFHIRHSASAGAGAYVARQLRLGDGVWLEGPFGDAWLRPSHRGPILAIAGGSGLAPIKSIVETALRLGMTQDIRLYFGARDERDIYLEAWFRDLEARHPHFQFIPVLSEPSAPTRRRVGTVIDAMAADLGSVEDLDVYLAGPEAMVEAGCAKLLAAGVRADRIFADGARVASGAQTAATEPGADGSTTRV